MRDTTVFFYCPNGITIYIGGDPRKSEASPQTIKIDDALDIEFTSDNEMFILSTRDSGKNEGGKEK